MADEAKGKGNAAFCAGNSTEAIEHFTQAIDLSPTNHVLYSNRSASLNKFTEALSDAQKTVDLKPDWRKGHSRLGAAYVGLHQYDDAIDSYKKVLEIDPNNEVLKSGLSDAQAQRSRGNSNLFAFGNVFQVPDVWAKLTADPTTRGYLQQPDFVRMIEDLQRYPDNINLYLQDQRMMNALGVMLYTNMKTATPEEMEVEKEKEGDGMEIGKEEVKKKAMSSVPNNANVHILLQNLIGEDWKFKCVFAEAMDFSKPSVYVNGNMLKRNVGRQVRVVMEDVTFLEGTREASGLSTDGVWLDVEGNEPSFLTKFVEVIGKAVSETLIEAYNWTNFGNTFDKESWNKVCQVGNEELRHIFIRDNSSQLL